MLAALRELAGLAHCRSNRRMILSDGCCYERMLPFCSQEHVSLTGNNMPREDQQSNESRLLILKVNVAISKAHLKDTFMSEIHS